MKKTRKIVVWSAAAAAFMVGGETAEAQSAAASIQASATIQAFLDVTQEEDLAFGSLLPGSGATVTPGAAPGAGQSLGRLRIQHNAAVAVSAALPTGLTLAGVPDLPVSFTCGFSATPTGSLDGSASACNAIPNRSANGDGSTRVSYLQVGGAILGADTSSRAPGTYEGTLTFTVTAVY